jgi:hypothetical protein
MELVSVRMTQWGALLSSAGDLADLDVAVAKVSKQYRVQGEETCVVDAPPKLLVAASTTRHLFPHLEPKRGSPIHVPMFLLQVTWRDAEPRRGSQPCPLLPGGAPAPRYNPGDAMGPYDLDRSSGGHSSLGRKSFLFLFATRSLWTSLNFISRVWKRT